MENDMMSIASDFSVIPESMVNVEDAEPMEVPMSASFFRSEHSSESSSAPPFCSAPAKVIFLSTQKIGSEAESPLSIIFNVTEDFAPKSSDRIALYKVGFSSSKDFLCFQWAPAPSASQNESHPYTIMFEAQNLPKDTEEFYQVCYLLQNGKISGVSVPFQLKPAEKCEMSEEIENAARKVLSIRVRELEKENKELKEQTKEMEGAIACLREHRTKFEEEMQKKNKNIVDLNEEINCKELKLEQCEKEMAELEQCYKSVIQGLETRLGDSCLKVDELKDSKSITEDRLQVLLQDNDDLKITLKLVKEELENSMREKAASEKIATDLSQRLQSVYSDYQNMAVMNTKLTKKAKKLRRAIALMETNTSDDWLCIEHDSKKEEAGEDEEECDEMDKESEGEEIHCSETSKAALEHTTMVTSYSSRCQAASSTTCSQHLTETVSSVRKVMDDIVTQLSLQTEEMKSLKMEIARRNADNHPEGGEASGVVEVEEREMTTEEVLSPQPPSEEAAAAPEELPQSPPPCRETRESSAEDDKVIYRKTFLPAHCTAPVFFLPPSESKGTSEMTFTPSAPSSDSIPPTEEAPAELPTPLSPETTPTARNAAVLRQFSENAAALLTLDGVQQLSAPAPEGGSGRAIHQDSDDEDYHSTGDGGGESGPNNRTTPSTLRCPMCPLEFIPSAIRLMEEHINNHLDRTCPMCSLAFQRNISQKTFETHVQSHFSDSCSTQSDADTDDPSGPWDPRDSRDPRRSFQLLEID